MISHKTFLFGMLLLLGSVFQSHLIRAQDVEKDIAEIEQKYNEATQSLFREFPTEVYFNGSIEEVEKQWRDLLSRYQAAEKGAIANLNTFISDFEKVYGSSGPEIDQKVKELLGSAPSRRTSWLWDELKKGLEKLNHYPATISNLLVENVKQDLTHITALSPLIVDKKYGQLDTLLELALEFDSSNDATRSLRKDLKKQRKTANAAIEAEIDAAKWESHSERFNGPGNPKKLAKEVERFLELEDEDGQKDSVIAVRIAGDWRVADKTILGEPINYGLPVHVAFRIKDNPKTAKVLSLTMITRDKAKKPPFQGNWVGDNWRVRTRNIKGADSAGGRGPNLLFKLLLSSGLIICGALALLPYFESNATNVAENVRIFAPYSALIGVITAGLGVFLFIIGILSPFSDIFPQIAAVAVGLHLGIELIIKKTSSSKAEDVVKKGEAMVQKLTAFQIPLGFACLALGLLHLLLGGGLFF